MNSTAVPRRARPFLDARVGSQLVASIVALVALMPRQERVPPRYAVADAVWSLKNLDELPDGLKLDKYPSLNGFFEATIARVNPLHLTRTDCRILPASKHNELTTEGSCKILLDLLPRQSPYQWGKKKWQKDLEKQMRKLESRAKERNERLDKRADAHFGALIENLAQANAARANAATAVEAKKAGKPASAWSAPLGGTSVGPTTRAKATAPVKKREKKRKRGAGLPFDLDTFHQSAAYLTVKELRDDGVLTETEFREYEAALKANALAEAPPPGYSSSLKDVLKMLSELAPAPSKCRAA